MKHSLPSADDDHKVARHNGINASSMDLDFLGRIVDGMEQGVLVWDQNGLCTMFTDRIFEVLELRTADIYVGMKREEFLSAAMDRGEVDQASLERTLENFAHHATFRYDRTLKSGRIVSTAARPMAGGCYVVSFTDATQQRMKSAELDEAKRASEVAQAKALRTLENETARQHEASMLAELGDWLQTCKSLEELYTVLKEYMCQLLPDTRGELYVYSNSRDVLDGAMSWGEADLHEHIKADSCWGLRRGRNYTKNPEKISFECAHVQEQHTPSCDDYICVPIVAHGDTVGLLHIQFNCKDCQSSAVRNPHEFAGQCGELISLAIANVKLRDELRDQSTRDPLTGLYNRRHFLEEMRSELILQERKGGTFGVISFDADKFKSFNDNHGHDAGDMILRAISETMHTLFVSDEVLCRYGGEEFMILLPSASHQQSVDAAELLRTKVQEISVSYAGRTLPTVTISCGVSSYAKDGTRIQDLLKNADDALYLAKDGGRNQVVDSSKL